MTAVRILPFRRYPAPQTFADLGSRLRLALVVWIGWWLLLCLPERDEDATWVISSALLDLGERYYPRERK